MLPESILFLLEVGPNNRQIMFDFQLALIDSIGVNLFMYEHITSKTKYEKAFVTIKEAEQMVINLERQGFTRIIPCGSIEFTLLIMTELGLRHKLNPINIPLELRKLEYVGRNIKYDVTLDKINFKSRLFLKDTVNYKGYTGFTDQPEFRPVDSGILYTVSDVVDIDSEWRVFVRNNKILGIVQYDGNFAYTPDLELIRKMIDSYTESPKSYTMDVMVCGNKTKLLEVHDIFSCGTYGFNHKDFVRMYTDWFYQVNS